MVKHRCHVPVVLYLRPVSKFLLGFVVASMLWGGGLYAYSEGLILAEEPEVAEPAPEVAEVTEEKPTKKRRRSKRRNRRRRAQGDNVDWQANARSGDSLGENEARQLDLDGPGGEQQLSGAQVERGVDGVFNKIRRCFVLAAGEDMVTGTLRIGFRIEPTGSVSRVNLSGPRAVSTGEAGDCIRTAAKSARFDSFDGPPMVAHYPVHLD